jgi:hypothetical protein
VRDRQNRLPVSQTRLPLVILLAVLTCNGGCRADTDPHRVQLRGTVGRIAPLIGGLVYELQTLEGTYTVRSSRRDLQPGQAVTIEGRWQVLELQSAPSPAVTEPMAPTRVEDQPRYLEEWVQP